MAAKHENEQSRQYFEQALRTFQKRGMVLEEARTLREQSVALLSREDISTEERNKAIQNLHATNETFTTRQAVLDAQITQHILQSHEQRVEV